MNYTEYIPDKRLKHIIACYWLISFDDYENQFFEDVILPDGCYDFIINQGSAYVRVDLFTKERTTVTNYALVGQRKKAVAIYQSSQTQIFAIRFKPHKINSLLKVDPCEIINEIVTGSKLKCDYVDPIRKILENKSDTAFKIKLIDELLIKKLKLDPFEKDYIDQAISNIISKKGSLNLTNYCAENKIHKSTLEKAFIKRVGISPKEFSSIIRFNYSCSFIQSGGISNLAEAALESGYYDQAHMCKEFKKYTHSSPKEFFSRGYILPQTGIAFQNALSNYF